MFNPYEQQLQQNPFLAPQPQNGLAQFLYAMGSGISGASASGDNYKPFGQGVNEGMKQLQAMRGNPLEQLQAQALMQKMQIEQAEMQRQAQAQQEFQKLFGGQMPQSAAPSTSQEALSQAAQMTQGGMGQQAAQPSQGMPAQPMINADPARQQAAKILFSLNQPDKAFQMLIPEQPKPFSLGEGQAQYDSSGRLIAERGKSTTLSPGQVFVDSTGKEIARGLPDQEKSFNNAATLRKEYTNQSGEFIKVRDAFGRIQAAGTNPSPAGDLALIFNYMKMLDPGSTVREGEFANAQNSASMPEWLRAKYNNVVRGDRLTPKMREDFMGRSQMLYDSAQNSQIQLEGTYKELATRNGLDPSNVTIDYKPKPKEEKKPQNNQMPYTQQQLKSFTPQQWEGFINQAVQSGEWTREQAIAKMREVRGG